MSVRTYNDIAVLQRLLLTMVWILPAAWYVGLKPEWVSNDAILFLNLLKAFFIAMTGHVIINFVFEGRMPGSHKVIFSRKVPKYYLVALVSLKLASWSGFLALLFPNY